MYRFLTKQSRINKCFREILLIHNGNASRVSRTAETLSLFLLFSLLYSLVPRYSVMEVVDLLRHVRQVQSDVNRDDPWPVLMDVSRFEESKQRENLAKNHGVRDDIVREILNESVLRFYVSKLDSEVCPVYAQSLRRSDGDVVANCDHGEGNNVWETAKAVEDVRLEVYVPEVAQRNCLEEQDIPLPGSIAFFVACRTPIVLVNVFAIVNPGGHGNEDSKIDEISCKRSRAQVRHIAPA
mmetsp:Transcript_46501/g.63330  ORF Transcript_46501/g.63330 Transcript_46501/m.63330 type:complete len:239 (-) Transcript_46501:31-747(-)